MTYKIEIADYSKIKFVHWWVNELVQFRFFCMLFNAKAITSQVIYLYLRS